MRYVLDFKSQTWHAYISMRNTFLHEKKALLTEWTKNYNFNQRLCSASDSICAIFSHVHGVVWCTPKKKRKEKTSQIATKSSLSLSCLSAKTVTVGCCSGLGKRQLSIHTLPLRKTVAAHSNALEMVKLSCYLMRNWDTECLNIDRWKFGSIENQ